MTERSPFLSAGWGRYQTRGLSFASYDGSSLQREPMGVRIGLGSAPSGECPIIALVVKVPVRIAHKKTRFAYKYGSRIIGRLRRTLNAGKFREHWR
jgi:hypothetical protein